MAWLVPVCAVGLLSFPSAFAARTPAARTKSFVSFRSFITDLGHSTYASVRRDSTVAASPRAFADMQAYLRTLYAGVDVRASFVTDGSYFDCVTVASQPAVRQLGISHIATPPPATAPGAGTGKAWTTTGTDARGAVVSCPAGTVPMQRETLPQVARYKTVRAFLSRGHGNPAVNTSDYRYAHAYQFVNNLGSSSVLNVWNPKVPTGPSGEDHSLSQHWVTGGSGANLQTAEAGWTKDLGFSPKKPVYFVYYTADGYLTTGCYNLLCGKFVQVNNSVALGAPVKPCCSSSTKDDHYTQQYYLFQGDWWLSINGVSIGYYPISVYNGGQMASNATEVDFGGEVNASVETAKWPQMGSGQPASAGLTKAAYQSSIKYIGLDNDLHAATLTPTADAPCYSIAMAPFNKHDGVRFFYGGKGAKHSVC